MSRQLPRRAWTFSNAWIIVAVGLGVALLALVLWLLRQFFDGNGTWLVVLGMIVVYIPLLFGMRNLGAESMERRVSRARQEWASANGWHVIGDTAVDEEASALVLPRGWEVRKTIASLNLEDRDRSRVIETWHLHPATFSRRRPVWREVVQLSAVTGSARLTAVKREAIIDPNLLDPRWSTPGEWTSSPVSISGDREAYEAWGEVIASLVERHQDLPFALTVGNGRVIVFALDDPRTSTAKSRLALAEAVAEAVESTPL